MGEYGPRTLTFHSFNNDLEQSFLLASVISRSGKFVMDELVAQIHAATDLSVLNELKKRSEEYLRLGKETVPNVLFILLMTKFEAYLEDIIITIAQVQPALISLQPGATEDEIRDRVGRLIYNQKIDVIANNVFEEKLNIPFSLICKAAKTDPKELDKAKAVRNIHVHNRGFVNKKNKARIGGVNENEYFEITMEYLDDIKTKAFLTALGIDLVVMQQHPELSTMPWEPAESA